MDKKIIRKALPFMAGLGTLVATAACDNECKCEHCKEAKIKQEIKAKTEQETRAEQEEKEAQYYYEHDDLFLIGISGGMLL